MHSNQNVFSSNAHKISPGFFSAISWKIWSSNAFMKISLCGLSNILVRMLLQSQSAVWQDFFFRFPDLFINQFSQQTLRRFLESSSKYTCKGVLRFFYDVLRNPSRNVYIWSENVEEMLYYTTYIETCQIYNKRIGLIAKPESYYHNFSKTHLL